MILSVIAVAMNRRDRHEIIGLHKISHSIKQPCSSVCLKKALKLAEKCCTLTKQSGKSNILIYSKRLNFRSSINFVSQTACLPVSR